MRLHLKDKPTNYKTILGVYTGCIIPIVVAMLNGTVSPALGFQQIFYATIPVVAGYFGINVASAFKLFGDMVKILMAPIPPDAKMRQIELIIMKAVREWNLLNSDAIPGPDPDSALVEFPDARQEAGRDLGRAVIVTASGKQGDVAELSPPSPDSNPSSES